MISTLKKLPYYWRKRQQMPRIVVNKLRQTIIKELQIAWQSLLYNFADGKIVPTGRQPQLIVSLTSIPPRLSRIHIALESIFAQTMPPDRVILWLSHEYRNPIFNQTKLELNTLPRRLLKLRDRGLEIRFAEDIGSHGKLLHSLREFPNDIIITVDDDALYDKNLISRLHEAYQQHGSDFVYCNHSQTLIKQGEHYALPPPDTYTPSDSSGLNVFIFGFAGVLYPPSVLHRDAFDTALYAKLAPYEDDTWFTTMRMLNGKQAFQVQRTFPKTLSHRRSPFTITRVNIEKQAGELSVFEQQLNRIMQHYKISW